MHVLRLHRASTGPNGTILARAGLDPFGPKTAQTHQKRCPVAPSTASEGSGALPHGQSPDRQRVGCLFVVLGPFFAPKWCQLDPSGPVWVWFVFHRDSEGPFTPCQPPFLVVCTPWSWSRSGARSTHTVHGPAYTLPNTPIGQLVRGPSF